MYHTIPCRAVPWHAMPYICPATLRHPTLRCNADAPFRRCCATMAWTGIFLKTPLAGILAPLLGADQLPTVLETYVEYIALYRPHIFLHFIFIQEMERPGYLRLGFLLCPLGHICPVFLEAHPTSSTLNTCLNLTGCLLTPCFNVRLRPW